jgi:hypothetical protein
MSKARGTRVSRPDAGQMLAEMLEMLAIEMLVIEIECSEQQMSADVAGRMVQRLK